MKQTTNYQLSQWEADDRVLRTDFNADNAKIDAALAAKCEIITGTYTGDGAAERNIYLGRKPKAVFLCRESGTTYADGFTHGGLALPDAPIRNALTITDTGFTVYYKYNSGSSVIATNQQSTTHHYIAFF